VDLVQELPAILEQVTAFQALERVAATKHLEMRILEQCEDLHQQFEAWTRKVPDIFRFDYMAAQLPLPEPENDVDVSLVHLSEVYWIGLMILFSVMKFFQKRRLAGDKAGDAADSAEIQTKVEEEDEGKGVVACPTLIVSPDLYASKCVHAMHLYWCQKSCIIESIAGLLAMSFVMRYYLNENSAGVTGDELHGLRRALDIELFGSRVRFLVTKVSGGNALVDAIDKGVRLPGDELSWF
jgi:hypothetical protein